MHPLVRLLLITAGTTAVALGVIGMFIPVLPTTPFLLLAAACYARSSDRFLHGLLTNRWFGAYLRNYREGRGMPLWTKLLTLAAFWLTLGSSIAFAVSSSWVRLLLFAIGVAVSIHLVRIKTRESPSGDTISESPPVPAAPPADPQGRQIPGG